MCAETSRKLKILCLIEASAWDGAKEQTYLFVREMSKYHNVELAINEDFKRMTRLTYNYVKIHYFEKYGPVKLRYNLNNYIRLAKIINENNYDLIITQSSMTMGYVRAIYPWLKNQNRIDSKNSNDSKQKKPKIIAVKRGDTIPNIFSRRIKYSIADEIVLVSKHVKAELEKNNSHKQQLHAIESGIDMSRFNPGDGIALDVRSRLDLSENDKVFINVSNWDLNRKRQHIILQAFSKLKNENCTLLLVGNGTDSKEASEKISEYGISDRVRCLGFRDDVPDLLRASDYFVMSSNSEGIAGALLQAMACGKVVLSTNAGGIQEYLIDGVNGYAADVDDIESFSSKFTALPDLSIPDRNKLEKAAIETAHKYSLDYNIERWLNLIEHTFSRKVARPQLINPMTHH
ncbi:MAG: glycosyltransferase [Gammaproteobacteria bacterium]|nr:glycosyltransferase [Gammaproteobacteria bacterium]